MKIMNIIVHGVALTLFEFFLFCHFFEIIDPLCQNFQIFIKIVKPYLNVAKFEPWPSLGKYTKFETIDHKENIKLCVNSLHTKAKKSKKHY